MYGLGALLFHLDFGNNFLFGFGSSLFFGNSFFLNHDHRNLGRLFCFFLIVIAFYSVFDLFCHVLNHVFHLLGEILHLLGKGLLLGGLFLLFGSRSGNSPGGGLLGTDLAQLGLQTMKLLQQSIQLGRELFALLPQLIGLDAKIL